MLTKAVFSMGHEHSWRASQWTLNSQQSLDDRLLDVHHERERVLALAAQEPEERAHRPLVSVVLNVRVVASHILLALLVQAIIGQVHARALDATHALVVLDRGETRQTLLVQVEHERIERSHGHVQPQVEFKAFDEQRIRNVFTHD